MASAACKVLSQTSGIRPSKRQMVLTCSFTAPWKPQAQQGHKQLLQHISPQALAHQSFPLTAKDTPTTLSAIDSAKSGTRAHNGHPNLRCTLQTCMARSSIFRPLPRTIQHCCHMSKMPATLGSSSNSPLRLQQGDVFTYTISDVLTLGGRRVRMLLGQGLASLDLYHIAVSKFEMTLHHIQVWVICSFHALPVKGLL